jgi:hypothetical protein
VVASATRVDPPPMPAKSLATDASEVKKNIVGAGRDAAEGRTSPRDPTR